MLNYIVRLSYMMISEKIINNFLDDVFIIKINSC